MQHVILIGQIIMDNEEVNKELFKHFETNFNNLEALVSNLILGYAEIACMVETLFEKHLSTLTDDEKLEFTNSFSSKRSNILNLMNYISQGNPQNQDDAPVTSEPMESTT